MILKTETEPVELRIISLYSLWQLALCCACGVRFLFSCRKFLRFSSDLEINRQPCSANYGWAV